jgi:hypothetical protein
VVGELHVVKGRRHRHRRREEGEALELRDSGRVEGDRTHSSAPPSAHLSLDWAELARNDPRLRFFIAWLWRHFWLLRAELARKPRSQTCEAASHERTALRSHPRKRALVVPEQRRDGRDAQWCGVV